MEKKIQDAIYEPSQDQKETKNLKNRTSFKNHYQKLKKLGLKNCNVYLQKDSMNEIAKIAEYYRTPKRHLFDKIIKLKLLTLDNLKFIAIQNRVNNIGTSKRNLKAKNIESSKKPNPNPSSKKSELQSKI